MRTLKVLVSHLLIVTLAGCSCSKENRKDYGKLSTHGIAKTFDSGVVAFNRNYVIEASVVNINDTLLAFVDTEALGNLDAVSLDNDGKAVSIPSRVATSMRFSYVLEHQGKLYSFYWRPGGIYLSVSDDGISWRQLNNALPVLSTSNDETSIYNQIWNVGVAVDSSGVWHLLAETSDSTPGQLAVGCAYSTATLTGETINFDLSRSATHVISHCGNPWVKATDGGLFVIHGQAGDPVGDFGAEWYVTASTFDGATWKTHKDNFLIGQPGIHVCDPHLVDLPGGGSMLTVSVDQEVTFSMQSLQSSDEIFADMIGGAE